MAKFDYNDTVYLIASESLYPERFGQLASVVGILEDRLRWPLPEFPAGVIYTVEFEDGHAIDIHGASLTATPPEPISHLPE